MAHKGARWRGLEMSYTYVNGIYEVTTTIHDGYKRFKSRNAQYRHSVDNDFMLEQWDFVSYAYPCLSVDRVIGMDSWNILIACDALDQSRTTTRQIGDFLRYIGCPLSIAHVRKALGMGVSELYFDDFVIVVRGEVNSHFDIRF